MTAWGSGPGTGTSRFPAPVRVTRASALGTLSAISTLLLTFLGFAPADLSAQGMRGWVGTTVQMVELRPLGLDTIARSEVLTDADGNFLYQGQPVSCVAGDICTGYLALAKDRVVAATQDVSLTAWGFGMQGLSFTTLLRGRAHGGSDLLWPRSGDAFDVLLGYAQLIRGPWKVRAGRQEIRSGLGFPAFDGGSVAYTDRRLQVEAYAGRSLARGLREPAAEALRSLDDFFFDESVYLFGGSARARAFGSTLTGRYQREILSDRSSLVGERASLDFVTVLPHARVSGSADYDFSFEHLGKSHLTVSVPLRDGHLLVEATARRYMPYFQLSTIWGFFEPVAYSEGELRADWSARQNLGVWASGGYRSYGDTHTTEILARLTDHGWRASAGALWRPSEGWTVDASYRMEWGPGGFLNSGDVTARYQPTEKLSVAASGTTFQQIDEFRVGEGRAIGGGLSFDWRVVERASLTGGFSMLRHRDGGNVFTSPWNQNRAWTSLRIDVGEDPGMANRSRGR